MDRLTNKVNHLARCLDDLLRATEALDRSLNVDRASNVVDLAKDRRKAVG